MLAALRLGGLGTGAHPNTVLTSADTRLATLALPSAVWVQLCSVTEWICTQTACCSAVVVQRVLLPARLLKPANCGKRFYLHVYPLAPLTRWGTRRSYCVLSAYRDLYCGRIGRGPETLAGGRDRQSLCVRPLSAH